MKSVNTKMENGRGAGVKKDWVELAYVAACGLVVLLQSVVIAILAITGFKTNDVERHWNAAMILFCLVFINGPIFLKALRIYREK